MTESPFQWSLLRNIPGMELNIYDNRENRKKLESIYEMYGKNYKQAELMARRFIGSSDPAATAGQLHDLISKVERAFNLDPMTTTPLLSSPTYLAMASASNVEFGEGASSLMLGSLGAVSAIEHDMIAGSLGANAYHIDNIQTDAAERYRKETGRDTFSIQDARETLFEDHSFDLIIADHLFRTVCLAGPQPIIEIAKEASRILKPGGRMLIVDQVPSVIVKSAGFSPEKFEAMIVEILRMTGFKTITRHEVMKYKTKRIGYDKFPEVDESDIYIHTGAFGLSAGR